MIAGIANHKNMCFVCEKIIVQNFGEARALRRDATDCSFSKPGWDWMEKHL